MAQHEIAQAESKLALRNEYRRHLAASHLKPVDNRSEARLAFPEPLSNDPPPAVLETAVLQNASATLAH